MIVAESSFIVSMKTIKAADRTAGRIIGRSTLFNVWPLVRPSVRAAMSRCGESFWKPASIDALGHGQKAHGAGVDDGKACAGQKQAGGDSRMGAQEPIDAVVDAGQRKQHADGKHGAGNTIAEGRQPPGKADEAGPAGAGRIGQNEGQDRR